MYYKAVDVSDSNKEVLVKINCNLAKSVNEYNLLRSLTKIDAASQYDNSFPDIIGGGEFSIKKPLEPSDGRATSSKQQSKMHSFIVMQKAGHSINQFLSEHKQKFSVNATCQVGIGLINCFEKLHGLGKVYNNLSLENVLVKKI